MVGKMQGSNLPLIARGSEFLQVLRNDIFHVVILVP